MRIKENLFSNSKMGQTQEQETANPTMSETSRFFCFFFKLLKKKAAYRGVHVHFVHKDTLSLFCDLWEIGICRFQSEGGRQNKDEHPLSIYPLNNDEKKACVNVWELEIRGCLSPLTFKRYVGFLFVSLHHCSALQNNVTLEMTHWL